jgi:hypothetical protein
VSVRRGDPSRQRLGRLEIGSEYEAGRVLLEVLREEGDGVPIVSVEGRLYEYVKAHGLWAVVPEDELRRIIGSFDGSECGGGKTAKTLRVSDPFARGTICCAAAEASIPGFFVGAAAVLAFADCAVRVTAAGEIERLPHSPEHRARVGYPFKYNPKAAAPRFELMMREHFVGDEDATEKIACEQEFFGACLLGIVPTYQKCLALPSDGGGGRSTLLKTIEAAFPVGTVSHIEAKDLRSAERRTRLVGKLLNFSDEVPPDAFIESEEFKKVVVGDVVTAEGKYRASFEFRPVAGHVFPIQISASAELSVAFFRRYIIIRYNRCFEGDSSRDLYLTERIVQEELAGVVCWLIAGAARLRRQRSYTIPPSHHREALRWRIEADTVTAFVSTTMVRSTFPEPQSRQQEGGSWDRHDWTLSADLYVAYTTWCRENGHNKPVASGRFGERLRKIPVEVKHTNKGAAYAIVERSRAERRERIRAEHEKREPQPIAGFFDSMLPPPVPPSPAPLSPELTKFIAELLAPDDPARDLDKSPDNPDGSPKP